MFCPECGRQNADLNRYCLNCGRSLPENQQQGSPVDLTGALAAMAGSNSPLGAKPVCNLTNDPEIENLRLQHPELIGVGGWLWWFCFQITILAPIVMLYEHSSFSSSVDNVDGIVAIVFVIFQVITGVSLRSLRPWALRLTKILLIGQFCFGIILIALQGYGAYSASQADDPFKDPSGTKHVAGAIIWFLYFKLSKRVRATYGRRF
jgi:hypothetical protein